MKVLVFIKALVVRFPLLFLASFVLLVAAGLMDAAAIFMLAPVVQFLIEGTAGGGGSALPGKLMEFMQGLHVPNTLGGALGVLLGFTALKAVLLIAAQYFILRTRIAVMRHLTVGTFTEAFRARWYFFSSARQGMLLNTFAREVPVIGEAFGAMARLFSTLLHLGIYLAVPLYVCWQATLASLALAAALAAPFHWFGRLAYRLGARNTRAANRYTSVLQESLGAVKVILGFGNQSQTVRSVGHAYDEMRDAGLKSQMLRTAIPQLYQPFGLLVIVFALFMTRWYDVALPDATVLLYALLKSMPTVGLLAAQKTSLEGFYPSYEQLTRVRERARRLRQTSGERPFTGFQRAIELDGVTFAYPEGPPVLREISLTVPKARMVAFVGRSGAGKSTLVDILMAFNEPQRGTVTVDGTDLFAFDVYSYRRRLGYVPQDVVLFNASVRENLLWAQADATQAQIEEACRLAHADEFIAELPEGFDTPIGDRGVRLSGGQQQRISLARAILRKPEILILDEATSALDTDSERLIQRAIDEIAQRTTIVVIAHRLSTIARADRIFVLEAGRVVEQGSYTELLAANGRFARMLRLQQLDTTGGRDEEAPAPESPEGGP